MRKTILAGFVALAIMMSGCGSMGGGQNQQDSDARAIGELADDDISITFLNYYLETSRPHAYDFTITCDTYNHAYGEYGNEAFIELQCYRKNDGGWISIIQDVEDDINEIYVYEFSDGKISKNPKAVDFPRIENFFQKTLVPDGDRYLLSPWVDVDFEEDKFTIWGDVYEPLIFNWDGNSFALESSVTPAVKTTELSHIWYSWNLFNDEDFSRKDGFIYSKATGKKLFAYKSDELGNLEEFTILTSDYKIKTPYLKGNIYLFEVGEGEKGPESNFGYWESTSEYNDYPVNGHNFDGKYHYIRKITVVNEYGSTSTYYMECAMENSESAIENITITSQGSYPYKYYKPETCIVDEIATKFMEANFGGYCDLSNMQQTVSEDYVTKQCSFEVEGADYESHKVSFVCYEDDYGSWTVIAQDSIRVSPDHGNDSYYSNVYVLDYTDGVLKGAIDKLDLMNWDWPSKPYKEDKNVVFPHYIMQYYGIESIYLNKEYLEFMKPSSEALNFAWDGKKFIRRTLGG